MKMDGLPAYYVQAARSALQRYFSVPAKMERTCQVEFTIQRNGTLTNIRVVRSSGMPNLDELALRAVRDTEKLGPLPASFKAPSVTTTVTFDFSE